MRLRPASFSSIRSKRTLRSGRRKSGPTDRERGFTQREGRGARGEGQAKKNVDAVRSAKRALPFARITSIIPRHALYLCADYLLDGAGDVVWRRAVRRDGAA